MNNQRGQMTLDFIFAITLILGFTALLFVLTFTLSVAAVVQYITFASARNYSAAHIDLATQQSQGTAKYQELIGNSVLKPLFSNGWYKVDAEPTLGDQTQTITGYVQAAANSNDFWGAGTHFVAPILAFKIPFFGSTVPDGDSSGNGFATYMGSYLGREPTTAECLQFVAQRWTAIRNLSVSNGTAYSTGTSASGYYPMADDGC